MSIDILPVFLQTQPFESVLQSKRAAGFNRASPRSLYISLRICIIFILSIICYFRYELEGALCKIFAKFILTGSSSDA